MLGLIFILENIICYLGYFKNTSFTEPHFSEATSRSARHEVYRVFSFHMFYALFTRAPFSSWRIFKVRALKF